MGGGKTRKQKGRGRVAGGGGVSYQLRCRELSQAEFLQCSIVVLFAVGSSFVPYVLNSHVHALASLLLSCRWLVGVRECLSADTPKSRESNGHIWSEVIDHVMRLRLCAPVP